MKHPNMLAVLDHGIEDGILFWVTELIASVNLSDLLRERATLPLSRAANISVQVLDALNYLHSHGILHRDIRPSNIFILGNDRAVLDDIGLNRIIKKCVAQDPRMKGLVGTPIYMSPEEVNRAETDHRSDLYTFGVVLYKMVTGQSYNTLSLRLVDITRLCQRSLSSFS
jgi:serine/threonine-protein kinase